MTKTLNRIAVGAALFLALSPLTALAATCVRAPLPAAPPKDAAHAWSVLNAYLARLQK